MPVFISYQHKDKIKASEIAERLRANRVPVYLDVLDAESQTTDDITSVITKRIEESTHLIAIVSGNTQQSWWVPFEIGEATITDRRIASYQTSNVNVPDYLKKWPIMTRATQLDMYIQEYKTDNLTTQLDSLKESLGVTKASSRESASDFHDTLKSRIQRGY